MKPQRFMVLLVALALVLSAGLGYGQVSDPCAKTYPFTAGQTIPAGSVTVTNDANYLYVTFTLNNSWYLESAHLWVGTNINDIPSANGNPIPGQFPWQETFTGSCDSNPPGTQTYTFKIAKTDLEEQLGKPLTCPDTPTSFYFAAHASIFKCNADGTKNSQTGWGGNTSGGTGAKWWFYDQYTWCCTYGTPSVCAETAFAKYDSASTCFIPEFSRWGWTNGPLSESTTPYVFNLYAAAGQCDTTKGTLVGTVSVLYSMGTVNVTYQTTGDFTLTQTHLYVGTKPYQQVKQGNKWVNTVAPGQYPYIHDSLNNVTTDTFTVSATGSIYVIAHGVVEGPCGDFTSPPE